MIPIHLIHLLSVTCFCLSDCWRITTCNLCTFLIKTTWGHSVFMSWMMEIGLSATVAHLCWQGGSGGDRHTEMMEGGSNGGKASLPSPQRETVTRRCCKNMQCLQCFLLAASPQSSLPFQMWLLFPSFPSGLLADSPSCFLADLQALPLTLCQANSWQPLWTVICSGGWAAR